MNYTKGGFPVWDDAFDKEHFTAEEIAESDMRGSRCKRRDSFIRKKGKHGQVFDGKVNPKYTIVFFAALAYNMSAEGLSLLYTRESE